MTIQLSSSQKQWLEEAVAAGRFASLQEAIDAAILGLMTDEDLSNSVDDARVLPLLNEARTSDSRGQSVSLDAFKARLMEQKRGA